MMKVLGFFSRITFLVALLMKGSSVVTAATDIVTDFILANAHYHGADMEICNTSMYGGVPFTNYTEVHTPNGPKDPAWFFLTLIFIMAPGALRFMSMSASEMVAKYLFCKKNKVGNLPVVVRFLIRLSLSILMPVLLIVRQFYAFSLLYQIKEIEKAY